MLVERRGNGLGSGSGSSPGLVGQSSNLVTEAVVEGGEGGRWESGGVIRYDRTWYGVTLCRSLTLHHNATGLLSVNPTHKLPFNTAQWRRVSALRPAKCRFDSFRYRVGRGLRALFHRRGKR
ncbi:hypothetical protein Q3G72_016068 [Acer saccharum]|nr:hypothetical protein Q3G72_016068 [Acer saccharum]